MPGPFAMSYLNLHNDTFAMGISRELAGLPDGEWKPQAQLPPLPPGFPPQDRRVMSTGLATTRRQREVHPAMPGRQSQSKSASSSYRLQRIQ
jgi:hypothetical protein